MALVKQLFDRYARLASLIKGIEKDPNNYICVILILREVLSRKEYLTKIALLTYQKKALIQVASFLANYFPEDLIDFYKIFLSQINFHLDEKIADYVDWLASMGVYEVYDGMYEYLVHNPSEKNPEIYRKYFNWVYQCHWDKQRSFEVQDGWFENRSLQARDRTIVDEINIGFYSTKFGNFLSSQNLIRNWISLYDKKKIRVHILSDTKDDGGDDFYKKNFYSYNELYGKSDDYVLSLLAKLNLDVLIEVQPMRICLVDIDVPIINITGFPNPPFRFNYWFGNPQLLQNVDPDCIIGNTEFLYATTEFPDIPIVNLSQKKTYGIFNRAAKFNDDSIDLWAEILRKDEDAILLVKFLQADFIASELLKQRFVIRGVRKDRIHIVPRTDRGKHLYWHNYVTVMLDSFPQTGGVTILEAQWMGVNMVGLKQNEKRFSAISGQALQSIFGNQENIALTKDEYISRAIDLCAKGQPSLESRVNMRRILKESSIYDVQSFADSFYGSISTLVNSKLHSI